MFSPTAQQRLQNWIDQYRRTRDQDPSQERIESIKKQIEDGSLAFQGLIKNQNQNASNLNSSSINSTSNILSSSLSRQMKDIQQASKILKGLKEQNIDHISSVNAQMKKLIRKQYFSSDAIQKQIKQISKRIFYYPSESLAAFIQLNMGRDVQSIIYKCAAFKHADLNLLNPSNSLLKNQIALVMNHLIPWGTFFLDLNSLQIRSTNIIGTNDDTKYIMSQYDLQIRISMKGITFKVKDKQVTPFQMKNGVLKQLALQSLQKKAIKIYYQFLKRTGSLF